MDEGNDDLLVTSVPTYSKLDKVNKNAISLEVFCKKVNNLKNAYRLLSLELDEALLQQPGLIGALTPKLESGWRSSTIGSLGFGKIENRLQTQLPPLIKPLSPGQNGFTGPVPLSYSFSWSRNSPQLVVHTDSESEVRLVPLSEPELIILITPDVLKNLVQSTLSSLDSFGTRLKQLSRPVTCIFLTGKTGTKKRSSDSNSHLSVSEICAHLHFHYNVRATRVCNNIEDVALLIISYTRSIAERPFKTGRLLCDGGLTFLPDNVQLGISDCASRGRGAGPVPCDNNNDAFAIRSWTNRVWLSQLGQWRGLTGEVVHAITSLYSTPRSFYNACKAVSNSCDEAENTSNLKNHPLVRTISDLEIRRGAGLLTSHRRLGPEFARRLVAHFTAVNPSELIE